jgi:hypothetical protein
MFGKLRRLQTVSTVLIMFFVVLTAGLPQIRSSIATNDIYIDLIRLLTDPTIKQQERVTLLEQVWQESCRLYIWEECKTYGEQDVKQRLALVYQKLVEPPTPLIFVNGSQEQILNLESALIRATSSVQESQVVLWGNGYIEMRLFSFQSIAGKFVLFAMNSTPPPVTLQIELNNSEMTAVEFDKGDHTWGMRSTDTAMLKSGLNILRIWYLADVYDKSLGLDRNAYIRSVTLSIP